MYDIKQLSKNRNLTTVRPESTLYTRWRQGKIYILVPSLNAM